jgi:hypothetical protein
MHGLWLEQISLACLAVSLAVYKISTRITISQDTEKTYGSCGFVLCETWEGTFQILARVVWVLFLSFPPCFFLRHFRSVSIAYCTTFHLCFCLVLIHVISPIIFAVFLPFTCLSFFRLFFLFTLFPFSLLSSFRYCPSFLFSIFYSVLPTHSAMSRSFFVLFVYVFMYECFIFIPAASCYLERLRKRLGLNKSTGRYGNTSCCLIL